MRPRLLAAVAATLGVAVALLPAGGAGATSGAAAAAATRPSVTAVWPASAPINGGTRVRVTGARFSHVTAVKFGTARGRSIRVSSKRTLYVTAPPHAAGVVNVVVTTRGGTSRAVRADWFTYVAPPTVTSVAPVRSPLDGASHVAVYGKNFVGVTGVRFGGVKGTSVKVSSPKLLYVTAPAHAAGAVNVVVSTAFGTSKAVTADHFTYVAPPAVTDVGTSCFYGQNAVSVSGANFYDVTDVSVMEGDTPVSGTPLDFDVASSNSLTLDTPPALEGPDETASVIVTTKYGTSSTFDAPLMTYVNSTDIDSLDVTTGPASGGTVVTITASQALVEPVRVTLEDGVLDSEPVDGHPEQVTVTMPAHDAGVVKLKVVDGTDCAGSSRSFTYS